VLLRPGPCECHCLALVDFLLWWYMCFVPGNALAPHALSTALGWSCMLQTFVQSGRTAAFHPGLHHLKCVGSTNLGGVLGFCALLTPPCDLRLSAMTCLLL
jgi:hypothetical protein